MDRTFELAERVRSILEQKGHSCAVIGAVALAAWGYPRSTLDIDLAVNLDPRELSEIGRDIELTGDRLRTRLLLPDAEDPLGGTLTITGDESDPVQLVNFYNPHRGRNVLGRSLLLAAKPKILGELAVVDLPHLVATKLYAGDFADRVDVLEVLRRNPECNLEEVANTCTRLGLGEAWSAIASELGKR